MRCRYLRAVAHRHPDRSAKGIVISVIAGVLRAFFYRFVAAWMSDDFENPVSGKMTNYSACVVFAVGILQSNVVFNTVFMMKPVEGEPVGYGQYFRDHFKTHLAGKQG